jgi:SAM-dependent methyltransferase|tara:strand:- start:9 stop:704 length:696 start_codon:yes stop_codon:yes gene_type:complete
MKIDSLDFYREHTRRYSELSHEFTHSVYPYSSHPQLRGDMDLLHRIVSLSAGGRSLDAGCGAGARDVHLLHTWGRESFGVDAVAENISLGKELHPEIAARLQVADLARPLPFGDSYFDLVTCNAVIQHLPAEITERKTLPELTRVLAPNGVLQLMFKVGSGVATVEDNAYGAESVTRTFQLYSEYRLLEVLDELGCTLIEAGDNNELGGLMYFDDPKPMRYCVFWVRKYQS